jgi:hypothetical protein
MLVGKYILNLIAKPFQVSREYAQIIYDQTFSPRLDKVLKKWKEECPRPYPLSCLYFFLYVKFPHPTTFVNSLLSVWTGQMVTKTM